MAIQKPSVPKGTRDFTPEEMVRRNYIFDTIRSVFKLYGYLPIETPAMENLSTLTGKYGEEGDKLLFRILNSGDILDGYDSTKGLDTKALAIHVSEKGLRYDLTVPFARFVVQHQHELVFPFKRYQVQPVWRADRPQKGRYREFYQCDVDVVGSYSLLYEVELAQITDDIFRRLNLDVVIHINNRKILAGAAETAGYPDKLTDITVAIDKLGKIPLEKVLGELAERGLPGEAIEKVVPFITLEGSTDEKFRFLEDYLSGSETGKKGIEEARHVLTLLGGTGLRANIELDLKLARGLNYYTGTIFEVKATGTSIGSICGGGRYDDLTGIFGLPNMPGVGISFGADRIYDVLNEKNLFPETILATTRVLFINFGPEEEKFVMKQAALLRAAGIPSEIYPSAEKIRKQMEYADRKKIPFVVLAGKDEMEKNLLTVKNMQTGEQQSLSPGELVRTVSPRTE
jgi:histidyl-tRNA synthetase